MADMMETLKDVFYEITGNYDLQITPATLLDSDLGLSSYGKIQLICAIEDHFDIEIPNKTLKRLKTVKDIADYLNLHT